MRHTLPIAPQFYVTAPQPCPYLEGRMERKLFTALQGDYAETLNDALSKQGFRRSQNVLYRPSCAECNACLSARIRVADFVPSRSQRRAAHRNEDLVRRASSPWATEEQFNLFRPGQFVPKAQKVRLVIPGESVAIGGVALGGVGHGFSQSRLLQRAGWGCRKNVWGRR